MPAERWAVVLSSDAIGLGAVRSLHRGGIPTVVVALDRWEPVRFSRFGHKLLVPKSSDVDAAVLETLATIEEREQKPVLIPTSDYFVHLVAKHRGALGERFICAVPNDEVVNLVLDKARDTELLTRWGIPMPRTVADLPSSPAELERALGLPLIVKPRTFLDKRELGWRNVVAHRSDQLEDFYRTHHAIFGRVIAQELIPGDDEELWECMAVFDAKSRLTAAFTFRKLRTVPAHYGQTSYGRSEPNEAIIELARSLGERLKYVGPADIDLKHDGRDDRYKYLELNPRLGLCNYFAARCGVNVALETYRVAGGGHPTTRWEQRAGIRFLAMLEDTGGRLYAGDSAPRVLVDLFRALAWTPVGSYFAWEDVMPGPFAAGRLCWRVLERLRRGQLASVFTKEYAQSAERTS